ncbi:MAG: radical SAM protein [Candidatus Hydrothermarchaeales archaeon]
MILKEVRCKTALSPSGLYDYALNPYRGCEHACIYCYAPSILRETRKWGNFVDVKVNISQVLKKELRRKKRGVVGIPTVTDAYQPVERRYELTRKCLGELLKHDFPICIQTKSSLVLRDIDLIKRFSQKEVGFTITTIDDSARKKYEPRASPVEERLSALEELTEEGIDTWVFLGPIMPYITNQGNDLENLIESIARVGVKTLLVDKMRMKPGLRPKMNAFYAEHCPELLPLFEVLTEDYYNKVKLEVTRLCRERGLKCEPCF